MVPDSTSSFDFKSQRVLLEELNISEGSSSGAKTGWGLNVVSSCFINDMGYLSYLIISKKAGLNDDLEDAFVSASLLDEPDFPSNIWVAALLQPADVDDHVNFISAVFNGLLGLEDLNFGRRISKGEADDCGNFDFWVGKIDLGILNEAGRDAHRGKLVL